MFTQGGLTQAKIDRHTLELAASQTDQTYPSWLVTEGPLARSLARLVAMRLMTTDHTVTDLGMAMLAPPRALTFTPPDTSLVTLPRTDATLPVVTCEWCNRPATRITHSDEPICMWCARNDYGTTQEALANTLTLGKRAHERLSARYA